MFFIVITNASEIAASSSSWFSRALWYDWARKMNAYWWNLGKNQEPLVARHGLPASTVRDNRRGIRQRPPLEKVKAPDKKFPPKVAGFWTPRDVVDPRELYVHLEKGETPTDWQSGLAHGPTNFQAAITGKKPRWLSSFREWAVKNKDEVDLEGYGGALIVIRHIPP